ncbi:hypothetical protein [Methylobacterium flocculans]|uniref:hypothetical protein n=1 Tax=Methylobacterium flocculans TaxID=2984843 RepID=UPI0021F3A468|nr:hypothetical protein [Methylobacterium sp. FF17]
MTDEVSATEANSVLEVAGFYDGNTRLSDDDRLPSVFTYRDGSGGMTRYWYQGQESYQVHDYDAERDIWIGRGTAMIGDNDTVDDFLAFTGEA